MTIVLLGGATISYAKPVTVSSYDMPNGYGVSVGGEYNYWDAGYTGSGDKNTDGAFLSGGVGKLTDGVVATKSWEYNDASGLAHTDQNLLGTGPYVGWTWGDPTLTFHFADLVNINSITFYVDNPGLDRYGKPRGGVAAPKGFTIGGHFYAADSPSPGIGPLAITLSDLALDDLKDLTLTINRNLSPDTFWVFVSEVTFDDGQNPAPVPEPSSFLLMGAGIFGMALWRRRSKG